ncbi:MAG TPA: sigma 54-interacting transcriptional regulator [Polyangia bacterium]|jgi:DNA-binding NtrC family response regulator
MGRSPSPPTEVIRRAEGVEHLVVQAARLEVVAGPDRGRTATLREGSLVIGSDPACDLVLTDGAVSRRQFEVLATPAGFLMRDLGSTNGTFIGELRVREVFLYPGAELTAGRTRLRFRPGGEAVSLPLSPRERFGALLGRSPAMRRCFALLERAAETDSTVLLEGESGTGKEITADSLHRQGPRGDGPFVVVDCGAIAPNLIESELFGHEKGAFTGATAARAGAFEQADGGTLFLDEIGELGAELQPRLLRFLEKREVRRVGGGGGRAVDVRVVAATNRRLDDLVAAGGFRQDLFYRLAVIRVELPPLRRRREDVPLLALELARRLRPDRDPASWLDDHALAVLQSHDWPGNVRELRNVVERLAALPELRPEAVLGPGGGDAGGGAGDEALTHLAYHDAKDRLLEAFERRYVTALLAQEGGVVARAAERAGVPRQTFFRLIRKHGLTVRE